MVAAEGAGVSEEELHGLVRARLAPFKVPRGIEFVTELPHTESGKLTKVGLGRQRQQRLAPAPASTDPVGIGLRMKRSRAWATVEVLESMSGNGGHNGPNSH